MIQGVKSSRKRHKIPETAPGPASVPWAADNPSCHCTPGPSTLEPAWIQFPVAFCSYVRADRAVVAAGRFSNRISAFAQADESCALDRLWWYDFQEGASLEQADHQTGESDIFHYRVSAHFSCRRNRVVVARRIHDGERHLWSDATNNQRGDSPDVSHGAKSASAGGAGYDASCRPHAEPDAA